MEEKEFKKWLSRQYPNSKTISNRISNCRKIERSGYNLDQEYDKDFGESLLIKFTYSQLDEEQKRTALHSVQIKGSLLKGTRTLKQAIRLYLRYKSSTIDNTPIITPKEAQVIDKIIKDDTLTNEEKRAYIKIRIGQSRFRSKLIAKWEGSCSVSKCALTEVLIASHIVPWHEASDIERVDVNNGLLLNPNYDKLFDKHIISFDNSGLILISKTMNISDLRYLNIKQTDKLNPIFLNDETKSYLKQHRKTFDIKEKTRIKNQK